MGKGKDNRKKKNTASESVKADANAKLAALKTKQENINKELKKARKGVLNCRKDLQIKKDKADTAEASVKQGWFGTYGTEEAKTAKTHMQTSQDIMVSLEKDVTNYETQLTAVEQEIKDQQDRIQQAAAEIFEDETKKPTKKKIRYFESAGSLELLEMPKYDDEDSTSIGASMQNLMSTIGTLFETDEFQIPPKPSPGRHVIRLEKERDAKIQQFNNMLETKRKSHEVAIKARESALAEARADMSKEKHQLSNVENNLADDRSNLAKTIQTLQHSSENEDELQKALDGLGLAFATLGKIAVTFDNVKKFWAVTKIHCERIAEECGNEVVDLVVDLEDDCLITDHLEDLLKNWATLGRMNVAARNAISDASANVDDFFKNIPVGGDRKSYIEEKVKMLQSSMMTDLVNEERAVKDMLDEDFDNGEVKDQGSEP